MLRKFKISIDGTQYLVEMEEVGAPAGAAPVVAAPAGAHVQTAAMPGTITNIHVAVGDKVEVNQPVMVLEAMKMENEVVAEVAGTVASIAVAKGDMVNPGQELFSIAQ